ncbi:ADP-ribose pyrophosphatase YjhB (NUDIX family) [Kineococcus xinjiangensis]|uniref:ADP-ribose pyrophosphatase YjhB (NUDIX family) n=1 Tax=Kineococcus xinjiangensis TaxID=512762 RepID=A0A2S6IF53_9ACTN|nr:CoA pyrophosphatase [Kineococcus xinjiangensis]PPK92839.1 ADP-ribose pyrophosphatase YjhB (NUDIX family) [Kineococcus xinjiangensis]
MSPGAPAGDALPGWLLPLAQALPQVRAGSADWPARSVVVDPTAPRRPASVLLLLAEDPEGGDGGALLLTERATGLRKHSGQVAFPGGGADPDDDGPAATALREAAEETGLDPAGVRVLGTLPPIHVPVSGYEVTPVVAWWHTPGPVDVVDPTEVARVEVVPLAELADPARRFRVRIPAGYVGPAFAVRGLLVWGFTGEVLHRVLALGGFERPWDRARRVDLADALADVDAALRASGGTP